MTPIEARWNEAAGSFTSRSTAYEMLAEPLSALSESIGQAIG